MKVAILGEFPSQPTYNQSLCIQRYSKHKVSLHSRFDMLNRLDVDVIYYFNVLDLLLHKEVFIQMNPRYKICSTVWSWRILQDKTIQETLIENEKFISVLSSNNDNILKELTFSGLKHRLYEAPDHERFSKTMEISTKGKLRVGYVGTYRKDKRFNEVLKPVLTKYSSILDPKIYGNAGITIPHYNMVEAYNSMDVLLMPSRWEGAPMPPLEAALCGRMTVGTSCGDLSEIFDYKSSLLFPPVDQIPTSIAQMDAAIYEIYTHRMDAIIKGEEARKVVIEKRDWRNIIKHYDEMFEMTFNKEK